MFLELEEGGQDRDEEAVKVYLIRFRGCMTEYL